MDRFVKKKKRYGDVNLLKIERGDKLKEIAELSAAAYAVEWSKRQDEIQLLYPSPGFINESAQVVFTKGGRVLKFEFYRPPTPRRQGAGTGADQLDPQQAPRLALLPQLAFERLRGVETDTGFPPFNL
jgi:hypothetical protein